MNRSTSSCSLLVLATLLLLVCMRSELFLRFPTLHFDSDQAVFGLMTDDLVAGHSIPTFAYGRRYMLALGVWMCAPLFAIWGSSVFLLKLPMLLLNLAVVVMLWIGLRRESLSRTGSALAILPFAVPSLLTSSRLVEHAGGNIEPFVSVLVAYFFRKRPVWLGLSLGIGFLNREFALFGFLALLVIDCLEGEVRARWKARVLSASVMGAMVFGLRELAERFTRFKGPSPVLGHPQFRNLGGFLQQQLPSLLGGHNRLLTDFNLTSGLSSGHLFVSILLLGWFAWCLVRLRPTRRQLTGFSTYLLLVGAGQAAAFLLFVHSPADPMLLRYVLLCLLGLVGLIGLAWQEPSLRPVTLTVIALCACANAWDYAQLEREYASRAPSSDTEMLASALERRGVHYAWADYWLAYELTFLTHGRVNVAPTYDDRIPRMTREVKAHASEAVSISKLPCAGTVKAIDRVGAYYLCPPAGALPAVQAPTTTCELRPSATLEL